MLRDFCPDKGFIELTESSSFNAVLDIGVPNCDFGFFVGVVSSERPVLRRIDLFCRWSSGSLASIALQYLKDETRSHVEVNIRSLPCAPIFESISKHYTSAKLVLIVCNIKST